MTIAQRRLILRRFTIPLAAFGLLPILPLFAPWPALAFTGQDPVFTRSFFDRCSVQSVRARLGADGISVKYSVDGSCPGGLVSAELAFRGGKFQEVFDLGAAGVLRSKGDCSDNPWVKAARCENVQVQGQGPRVSALLADQPYSPTGEVSAPFSLQVAGAADAFRRAHDSAERPNPPIAPVGVQLTQPIGTRSVKASWIAPDESGDRPFLHFLVQARPHAMEGAAWVDLGKVNRWASARYSATMRLPPALQGTDGWDVRVCSATGLAMTCGEAVEPRASVLDNTVLAGPRAAATSNLTSTATSVGRTTATARVGVSQSTCERAADAQARNSPAAAALAAKCRAEGGQPTPAPAGPDLNALADQGAALSAEDALAASLRESLPDDESRRGFDIAMAAAKGQTEWGPGKQKIYDSLSQTGQVGFKTATSYLFDLNRYTPRAQLGATIAAADAELGAERSADADARYWLGFDIATAIFGDPAQGAQGNRAPGPGSMGIRNSLSANAQRGFDAAMNLHLARTY